MVYNDEISESILVQEKISSVIIGSLSSTFISSVAVVHV